MEGQETYGSGSAGERQGAEGEEGGTTVVDQVRRASVSPSVHPPVRFEEGVGGEEETEEAEEAETEREKDGGVGTGEEGGKDKERGVLGGGGGTNSSGSGISPQLSSLQASSKDLPKSAQSNGSCDNTNIETNTASDTVATTQSRESSSSNSSKSPTGGQGQNNNSRSQQSIAEKDERKRLLSRGLSYISLSSDEEDHVRRTPSPVPADYIDPEIKYDHLPQPFRTVEKVMNGLLDRVWLELERRLEERRMQIHLEKQRKISTVYPEPSTIACETVVDYRSVCHLAGNRFVCIGTSDGMVNITTVSMGANRGEDNGGDDNGQKDVSSAGRRASFSSSSAELGGASNIVASLEVAKGAPVRFMTSALLPSGNHLILALSAKKPSVKLLVFATDARKLSLGYTFNDISHTGLTGKFSPRAKYLSLSFEERVVLIYQLPIDKWVEEEISHRTVASPTNKHSNIGSTGKRTSVVSKSGTAQGGGSAADANSNTPIFTSQPKCLIENQPPQPYKFSEQFIENKAALNASSKRRMLRGFHQRRVSVAALTTSSQASVAGGSTCNFVVTMSKEMLKNDNVTPISFLEDPVSVYFLNVPSAASCGSLPSYQRQEIGEVIIIWAHYNEATTYRLIDNTTLYGGFTSDVVNSMIESRVNAHILISTQMRNAYDGNGSKGDGRQNGQATEGGACGVGNGGEGGAGSSNAFEGGTEVGGAGTGGDNGDEEGNNIGQRKNSTSIHSAADGNGTGLPPGAPSIPEEGSEDIGNGSTKAGNDLLGPRLNLAFSALVSCSDGDAQHRFVAVGLVSGVVVVWDIMKSVIRFTKQCSKKPIYATRFYNHRLLLAGDQEGTLFVIDVMTKEVKSFAVDLNAEPARDIAAIRTFPRQKVVLSLSSNGTARLHEINMGKIICNLSLEKGWDVVMLVKRTLCPESATNLSESMSEQQRKRQSIATFLASVSDTYLSIKGGTHREGMQSPQAISPRILEEVGEDSQMLPSVNTQSKSRGHSPRKGSISKRNIGNNTSLSPGAMANDGGASDTMNRLMFNTEFQNKALNAPGFDSNTSARESEGNSPPELNTFQIFHFNIEQIMMRMGAPRSRRASVRVEQSPVASSPSMKDCTEEMDRLQATNVLKEEVFSELSDDMTISGDLTHLYSGTEISVILRLIQR
eukprot:Nk52_evm33s228 gene=Nk52_evmTU33s228